MPKNRNERQFDEYRAWQWVKHDVLRDYVARWPTCRRSPATEVVAVDGCAGAGSYRDPDTGQEIADGSPIIFATRAALYNMDRGPSRTMKVICVESEPNNFAELHSHVERHAPMVTLHHGPLARFAEPIAERLGNAPALVFLDPIGVKPIAAEHWRPLLTRTGKTDLFVTLHFAYVHRAGGMLMPDGEPKTYKRAAAHAANVDRLFDTRDWREIAVDSELGTREREQRYVQLYLDHVIGQRHRWTAPVPVRERYSATVRYWLIHASNDWKPYELMNDAVAALNKKLLLRDYPGDELPESEGQLSFPGVLDGMAQARVDQHHGRVRANIAAAAIELLEDTPGSALPLESIEHLLVPKFFGEIQFSEHWSIVKELVKNDRLLREGRKAARRDPKEMISLPTTPATDPEPGAKIIPLRRVA